MNKTLITSPKVTIIIPIYGVEKYIEQCAVSLFNQSYHNIEYIFVNDCTKDRSVEVLGTVIERYQSLRDRIKIINHPTNSGLAVARKTGITESSGYYLFHIDSDDWLEIDAISNLVRKAELEQADMVVGDFFINYETEEYHQHVEIKRDSTEYINEILSRNRKYSWTLCNRLLKRDVQVKALPIAGINMGEDYVTIPRILFYCNKIAQISQPIYHYRQVNTTSYTKRLTLRSMQELVNSIGVLTDFFIEKNNSSVFMPYLKIGRMRIKYDLCLSSSKETYEFLPTIFPEISYREGRVFIEKTILFLCEKQMYSVMKYIVNTGLWTKKAVRLLFLKKS